MFPIFPTPFFLVHLLILLGKKLQSHPVYDIIEKRARDTANSMRAEYWAVSAKTGNGISDLFIRIAALSFHAMALREMHSLKLAPINVGTETISK